MKPIVSGSCLFVAICCVATFGFASEPRIIVQLPHGASVAGPFTVSIEANESNSVLLYEIRVGPTSPSTYGVQAELEVADRPSGSWNLVWCQLEPVRVDSVTVQFTFRLHSSLAEKAAFTLLLAGESGGVSKRGWRIDLANRVKDE
jgi:hypothetical protein